MREFFELLDGVCLGAMLVVGAVVGFWVMVLSLAWLLNL